MQDYHLAKQFEGEFHSEAYLCTRGVATIGQGLTYYSNGKKVKLGDKINKDFGEIEFIKICTRDFEPIVNQYTWLNWYQKEALRSLVFNCGKNFAKRCPKLHRALLEMDFIGIRREWDFGLKDNLFTRRTEELAFFFQYPYK